MFDFLPDNALYKYFYPQNGVTLSFLSYGGSSLLISCISIGIILSISKKMKKESVGKLS